MRKNKQPDLQRRSYLKAIIATALASPLLALPGCGGGGAARRTHFALAPRPDEVYLLHAGDQRHVLQAHTEGHDPAGLLGATHYLDNLALPAETVQRLHVTARRVGDTSGAHRLVMTHLSVDPAQVLNHAARISAVRRRMGMRVAVASGFDRRGDLITAIDTATTLVFHHPDLMSLEAQSAAVVVAHIQSALPFDELWQEIANRPGSSGDDNSWCEMVPLLQDDGTPYRDDQTGDLYYDYRPMPDILALAGAVIGEVLRTTREDEALRDKLWNVTDGAPNRTAVAQALSNLGAASYDLAPSFSSEERHSGAYFKTELVDAATRQVRVEVRNKFNRYGALSVSFKDADGQAMTFPVDEWTRIVPASLLRNAAADAYFLDPLKDIEIRGDEIKLVDPSWRYITLLSPTANFMAIPINEGFASAVFLMPEGAASATLRLGTLGYDFAWLDSRDRETVGTALTLVINYLVPTFMLGMTTGATAVGTLINRLITDPTLLLLILQMGFDIVMLIIGSGSSATVWRDMQNVLIKVGDIAVKVLLEKAFAQVLATLLALAAIENAVSLVPFAGWAYRVASVTATVANLAVTTAEVLSSTSRVDLHITLAMDVEITVHPDLDNGTFPTGATQLQAQLNLGGATFSSPVVSLPPEGAAGPITLRIPGVPSGGTGKITVVVTDGAGTIRGKGFAARYQPTSEQIAALAIADGDFPEPLPTEELTRLNALVGQAYADTPALLAALAPLGLQDLDTWRRQIAARLAVIELPLLLDRDATSSTLSLECTILEQLVPLTPATRYQHQRVLQYTNGQYSWRADTARPVASLTCDNREGALCELGGITVAQRSQQLAFAWRSASSQLPLCGSTLSSTQAWTVQHVSTRPGPSSAARTLSLDGQACGVQAGVGIVYQLLGPADGSGANYLLDGRSDRLLVRRINNAAADSLELNRYTQAIGAFAQLPTAVAWHPQGYLVAVHAKLHKLEVLDLNQNPVNDDDAPPALLMAGQGVRPGLLLGPTCVATTLDGRVLVLESRGRRVQAFDVNAMPVPCFKDEATFALRQRNDATLYLDMSVDATGHIFVLCREGGALPALEIYQPDGSFLGATPDFTAGRMAVDLWRNIYTLNLEQMSGRNARPEPTVSEWYPVTPTP